MTAGIVFISGEPCSRCGAEARLRYPDGTRLCLDCDAQPSEPVS